MIILQLNLSNFLPFNKNKFKMTMRDMPHFINTISPTNN